MSRGYDNSAIMARCVLDIPLFEGTGLFAHDISRPPTTALDKTMTLNGPPTFEQLAASGQNYLDMDAANPDFLELLAAESTDLDFTSGDFTLLIWVFFHNVGLNPMIFCRGSINVDGYYLRVMNDGTIQFVTNQGVRQTTESAVAGIAVLDTWYQLAATRSGADALIYLNGVDVTVVAGTHIDPTTSARKLIIGCYDDEVQNGFHGHLAHPRMWDRLLTPLDMLLLFETERNMFGL